MHCVRLIAALGLSIVALEACGNYSNEDITFLEALPDRSALLIQVPASPGQALTSDASLHDDTVGIAQNVNAGLAAVLGVIDLLPTINPSARSTDSRTWGPYDDQSHSGFQIEVTLTRVTDHYDFAMSQQRKGSAAAFVPIITGTFFTPSAHLGHGTLDLDSSAAAGIGLADTAPNLLSIRVVYANDQKPRTVDTTIASLSTTNGTPQTITYAYQEQPDQSGQLVFDLNEDALGDGGIEDLHLVSVWNATGAGRADGDLTGGVVSAAFGDGGYISVSECWSAAFAETYYDSAIYPASGSGPQRPGIGCDARDGHSPGCPDGDAGACVLPPAWP